MDEMLMTPPASCEDTRIASMFSHSSCTLEGGSSCCSEADYPIFPRTVRRRSCLSQSDHPLSASPSSKVRGGSGFLDKRVRGGQQPALGSAGMTLQSSHSQGSLRISFSGAGSAGSGSLQDLNAMITTHPTDSYHHHHHPHQQLGSSPRTSAPAIVGSIPESSPFIFSCPQDVAAAGLRIKRVSLSDPQPPGRRSSHSTLGSPDDILHMINSLTCSHSGGLTGSATHGSEDTLHDCAAAAATRNCRSSFGSIKDLSNPATPTRGYSFGRAASLPFRVGSQLSLLAYAEEAVLLQQVCSSTLASQASLGGHATSDNS